MPQNISKYDLYFDDARLRMTIAGRMLVRVVSYVSYLVLVVATFVFLLARDIPALFYFGMFLVLVLMDLLIHRGEGDTPISELPKAGKGESCRNDERGGVRHARARGRPLHHHKKELHP